MADRQALSELQARLASRLQAARDEGPSVAWLAAESAGVRYLFPLAQAGEIFPWAPLQPVPYTAPWFLGVASLRGNLAGVVDPVLFAGVDDDAASPAARRPQAQAAESSLLTLNTALGVPCALKVDRLLGLRGGDDFTSTAPRADGAPAWYGGIYTDGRQQRWQEIDLQALAADPRFLHIAA